MENLPKEEIVELVPPEVQFREETLRINGADVEIGEYIPEKLKSEIPVLIAPGWSDTVDVHKKGMKILADLGRRAVSLSHSRHGGAIPNSFNKEAEKYPDEELRKAQNLLGLLEQKNIEKVDVVAHSEGAINACIAAMIHPEKFRSIVLYAPAGLIGNDNLLRLMWGTMIQAKRKDLETMDMFHVTEEEKAQDVLTARENLNYIKENPLRAFKETLAISQVQIQDILKYLRSKGINVVVMAAVEDTFFPMGDIEEEKNEQGEVLGRKFVGDRGMQKNVDSSFVDGFLSIRGGHVQFKANPEIMMPAVESMLTALENKSEKIQILQRESVKKFIEFRGVKPEDFYLIEELARFPKNLLIAELHNLFNMGKEGSARELENLIENSKDNEKKAMLKIALEFYNKYDWMTSLNLVRTLEGI